MRFGEATTVKSSTNFYDDSSDLAIYDHLRVHDVCPPAPPIPLAHDLLDPTADIMAANSASSAGIINALTPGGIIPNPAMASAVMSEDERKVMTYLVLF